MRRLLLLCLVSQACWAKDLSVGDKENLTRLHLARGDRLTVSVDPTFKNDVKPRKWHYLAPQLDGKHLKLIGESRQGILQVFVFQAVGNGHTLLKMPYLLEQPKPDDAPVKVYTLEITTP